MVDDWFAEPPFAGYQQRYRVTQRLFRTTTPWQTLEVLDLESFGRALVLEGTLQTSVGEDYTYHEPLVHIPLFAHPNPRRVLIVGGGDGGALRHALLHSSVERGLVVEIDQAVVDASLRYLPEISDGAYADPRAQLLVQDGARYMAETDERFDVMLVDSTDPVGPAAALIGHEFLTAARGVLAPGGLMAMQSGSPLTQPREFHATVSAFQRVFPVVRSFFGWVPIYPGVIWSWVSGSDEVDPASFDELTVTTRVEALKEAPRLYSPAAHRAAFAMPPFVHKMLQLDHPPTQAELRAAGHPLPGVVG